MLVRCSFLDCLFNDIVASTVNEIHEFEFLTELIPYSMKYDEAIQNRKHLEELKNAAKEDFA